MKILCSTLAFEEHKNKVNNVESRDLVCMQISEINYKYCLANYFGKLLNLK